MAMANGYGHLYQIMAATGPVPNHGCPKRAMVSHHWSCPAMPNHDDNNKRFVHLGQPENGDVSLGLENNMAGPRQGFWGPMFAFLFLIVFYVSVSTAFLPLLGSYTDIFLRSFCYCKKRKNSTKKFSPFISRVSAGVRYFSLRLPSALRK